MILRRRREEKRKKESRGRWFFCSQAITLLSHGQELEPNLRAKGCGGFQGKPAQCRDGAHV